MNNLTVVPTSEMALYAQALIWKVKNPRILTRYGRTFQDNSRIVISLSGRTSQDHPRNPRILSISRMGIYRDGRTSQDYPWNSRILSIQSLGGKTFLKILGY